MLGRRTAAYRLRQYADNQRKEKKMKTAIYIQDGDVQLVLTPESEFEKNALKAFQQKPLEAKIKRGSFYDCQGGWIRQCADDDSLIMRMKSS